MRADEAVTRRRLLPLAWPSSFLLSLGTHRSGHGGDQTADGRRPGAARRRPYQRAMTPGSPVLEDAGARSPAYLQRELLAARAGLHFVAPVAGVGALRLPPAGALSRANRLTARADGSSNAT